MAIINKDAVKEVPHLFDRIHMDLLEITQERRKLVSDEPMYQVRITYREACEQSADVHYKDRANTITIADYFAESMSEAAQGKMDMIQALGAIQNAVAVIIKLKQNINTEVV